MKLRSLLATAATLALIGGGYLSYNLWDSQPLSAAETPAAEGSTTAAPSKENTVVARVNGEEIRQSDILALMSRMDAQAQKIPPQSLLPMVLDRLINSKLILDEAKAQKLDTDPVLAERLEEAKKQLMVELFAERAVQKKITPEALKARYNKFLKDNPPQDEMRAGHILVKTEAEANDLIKQIKAGGDFAALAKEKSIDPSAARNAGDLGYFTKEQMVAPFATAVFAAKPGTMLDKPVQTEFGWHVIKVVDKRKTTPPTFEQLEPELRNAIAQETLAEILKDLEKKAKVERYNWDGTPYVPPPAKK